MDSLQTKAHRAAPENLMELRHLCESAAERAVTPDRIGRRQTLVGARREWAEIALSEAVSVRHAAEAFRMRANTITRHRCVYAKWIPECRAFAETLAVAWERFSVATHSRRKQGGWSMSTETEYGNFRAAMARRLHDQGKTPAQIRAALADIDAKARQRREAAKKQQSERAA